MPTPSPETEPARLAAIILGASQYPSFPASRRLDNPSFARSAAAFRDVIARPGVSLAGAAAVLDLFDSDEDPVHLIRRMKEFLKARPELTDIIIYYCGHGSFLADAQKTYILTLRATEPDNEAFTALPVRQTRLSLDAQLALKRVFLVLDCCYAGRAATEWQSDSVGHMIEEQVFQAFPRRGTALFAASSGGQPAIAPEGEQLTMFSGNFIETLNSGIAEQGKALSFRDVFAGTRQRIVERYGAAAAIPVIHAPYQPEGDISLDPFFINRAFARREPVASPADREEFELAVADLDRPLARTRKGAVEALGELLARTRAPAFRAELVAQLETVRDTDDSSSVRIAAAIALGGEVEPARAKAAQPPEPLPVKAVATMPEPMAAPEESIEALDRTLTIAVEDALEEARQPDPVADSEATPSPDLLRTDALAEPESEDTVADTTVIDDPVRTSPWLTVNRRRLLWSALALPVLVAIPVVARFTSSSPMSGDQARLTTNGFNQTGTVVWSGRHDSGNTVHLDAVATFPEHQLTFHVRLMVTDGQALSGAVLSIAYMRDSGASGDGAVWGGEPITEVKSVWLKNTEDDAGTPLSGEPFVDHNTFGLILSSNTTSNAVLLKQRPWLEVRFSTSKSDDLVLTLQRNDDALKLWSNSINAWQTYVK